MAGASAGAQAGAGIRICGSVEPEPKEIFSALQPHRTRCVHILSYHIFILNVHKVGHPANQCCGSGSESGSTCFWASRIRIRILLSSCKNSKKNPDFYYFVTLFDFLSLKNNVNVGSKSNNQKILC
jgi:hypothetical protein